MSARVMIVPPWPSLAAVKLPATYEPSSSMFAVSTPSVTVSVPLWLLMASVKLRWLPWPFVLVGVTKVMSSRSIRSPVPNLSPCR